MFRNRYVKFVLLIIGVMAVAVSLAGPASAGSAASPKPPPGKASAPPTDLKHYPKLPAPHVNPSKWGGPTRQTEVIATTVARDGSGHATIYTPVAGESAAVLYRVLKAQGIRGLENPAAHATARKAPVYTKNALTSCRYGTAQTFRCASDTNTTHQIRWADGCCNHPQVWFVDHTGSQWPVAASTYEWNIAHGVDSLYVWATCPGYSGQYCVNVTDRNAGCSGWQGLTSVSWDSNYYMTGASVQLNDYNGTCTVNGITYNYNKNANGYRQDACHEMGHALGMGHNSSTNSCIYGTIINSAGALVPDSNDFTLIAQLYNDGNE
jgi:hypothetical protein